MSLERTKNLGGLAIRKIANGYMLSLYPELRGSRGGPFEPQVEVHVADLDVFSLGRALKDLLESQLAPPPAT